MLSPTSELKLIIFSFVILKSGSWSPSVPSCSWSSCISYEDKISNKNICEMSTVIKQGCKNEGFPGFKYLCCPKRKREGKAIRKKCKPEEDSSNNIIMWPNDEGKWTRNLLNCNHTPSIEAIFIEDNVKFFYFRSNNNTDRVEIFVDNVTSLKNAKFIDGAPVKLITHGFMSNATEGLLPPLRKQYCPEGNCTDVNVIGVDWGAVAGLAQLDFPGVLHFLPCYSLAVAFVRYVGRRNAELLQFLIEENKVALKDIHVIGHSLGAHASGFTGKYFFDFTQKTNKLPRITGLDPAGPLFKDKSRFERIDHSDADFVDIIHTAISDLQFIPQFGYTVELGLDEEVGHADFYPNGGGHQPGCPIVNISVIHTNESDYFFGPQCSHRRSYVLYAETIIHPPQSNVFRGVRCSNLKQAKDQKCNSTETALMGACTTIDNSTRKIYYVKTTNGPPYALDPMESSDYTSCPILFFGK